MQAGVQNDVPKNDEKDEPRIFVSAFFKKKAAGSRQHGHPIETALPELHIDPRNDEGEYFILRGPFPALL